MTDDKPIYVDDPKYDPRRRAELEQRKAALAKHRAELSAKRQAENTEKGKQE